MSVRLNCQYLKDFISDAQLDGFLAYFRENGIPGVPLKAVLTPVNAHWNALQLYEALKEEARMMP